MSDCITLLPDTTWGFWGGWRKVTKTRLRDFQGWVGQVTGCLAPHKGGVIARVILAKILFVVMAILQEYGFIQPTLEVQNWKLKEVPKLWSQKMATQLFSWKLVLGIMSLLAQLFQPEVYASLFFHSRPCFVFKWSQSWRMKSNKVKRVAHKYEISEKKKMSYLFFAWQNKLHGGLSCDWW